MNSTRGTKSTVLTAAPSSWNLAWTYTIMSGRPRVLIMVKSMMTDTEAQTMVLLDGGRTKVKQLKEIKESDFQTRRLRQPSQVEARDKRQGCRHERLCRLVAGDGDRTRIESLAVSVMLDRLKPNSLAGQSSRTPASSPRASATCPVSTRLCSARRSGRPAWLDISSQCSALALFYPT